MSIECYRYYATNNCVSGQVIGFALFNQQYCFNFVFGSAYFNCDGSVSYYFSNLICSGQPSRIDSSSNVKAVPYPTDTCLYSIGIGKSVLYYCHRVSWTSKLSGYLTVRTYKDASCSGIATGFVSYACGVCIPSATGFYKFTCSQSSNQISYTFSSYLDSDCSSIINNYQASPLIVATCSTRSPIGGLGKSDVFANSIDGIYDHAMHTLVVGSFPPTPPIAGQLKQ